MGLKECWSDAPRPVVREAKVQVCRREPVQVLMGAMVVVVVEVLVQDAVQLMAVHGGALVEALLLDAAPKPLDEGIVRRAPPANADM